MKLPDKMTYREAYSPAMEITEQAEADTYFEALVDRQARVFEVPHEQAKRVERSNLGYYAGYYSEETRRRVERLFRCQHPVFGPAAAGVGGE